MNKIKPLKVLYALANLFSVYIFYKVGLPFLPICIMGGCMGSFTEMFGIGGLAVATYLLAVNVTYIATLKVFHAQIDWNKEFKFIAAYSIFIFVVFFYLFLLWKSL